MLTIKRKKRYITALLAGGIVLLWSGCQSNQNPPAAAQTQEAQATPDPAAVNVAAPLPQAQAAAPPRTAPVAQSQEREPNYQDDAYSQDNTGYTEAAVQAPQPPPALPVYSQPACPGDNYMWTPGYWNYASAGYYWVPGAWVVAPYTGALWTPPYWGYDGGRYRLHHGYWSTHVGFYGGVNYGFGYVGRGYYGGYWNRDRFTYNRAVNNVKETVVHNVYNRTVVNNIVINKTTIINNDNRVSYNGGRGGIQIEPDRSELAVLRERRAAPVPAQMEAARANAAHREQFAEANHGRPPVMAAPQPLATAYRAPAARPVEYRPAQQMQPHHEAERNAPVQNRQVRPPHQETRPMEQRPQARPEAAHPNREVQANPRPAERERPNPKEHPQDHDRHPQ